MKIHQLSLLKIFAFGKIIYTTVYQLFDSARILFLKNTSIIEYEMEDYLF